MFDLELCTQALGVTQKNGFLHMLSFFYNITGAIDLDFLKTQNSTCSLGIPIIPVLHFCGSFSNSCTSETTKTNSKNK